MREPARNPAGEPSISGLAFSDVFELDRDDESGAIEVSLRGGPAVCVITPDDGSVYFVKPPLCLAPEGLDEPAVYLLNPDEFDEP